LKNWIPKVLQSAVTFVSSDITKGNAWFESLSTELKNSDYAILCLTPDNIKSPWLNFEAGALFDRFNSSKVCPFLFNIQPSDIDGPLKQLQAAVFTKEDIFKLISSLNDLMETKIDNERFKDVFEKHWPELKQSFDNIHVKQTQPVKN
jgi:hypothetical protein